MPSLSEFPSSSPGPEQPPLPFPVAPADPPPEPPGPPARRAAEGSAEDRLARAALSRLIEPGDEQIGAWLAEFGAAELVARIADGRELPRPPRARRSRPVEPAAGATDATESVESAEASREAPAPAGRRLDNYRVRLRGLDPLTDLERFRRLGGRLVCPGDTEWPSQLDDLGHARPVALWVRGNASLRLLALRSVAVVGARACTDYGTRAAADLAADLAQSGWVVVSGAAYGIDAAAHRGALAVGGATVAVLACGADRAYPAGNTALIARIREQGMLVSELPPGEHPTRARFVLRNRVIAALTRGTVVVEAARRSGALSTARRAAALNRVVMGVPGSCYSELSTGVHELIRSGAGQLVCDGAEVVELVGAIGADLAPERHGPVLPRDALPAEAARVLDALPPGREGAPLPLLAHRAGLTTETVLQRLYELGALGFVARAGGQWRLL